MKPSEFGFGGGTQENHSVAEQPVNRWDSLEGAVLIAVTNYPHLERALPQVLTMIDRVRP